MYKKLFIVVAVSVLSSEIKAMDDDGPDMRDFLEALRDSGIPIFGSNSTQPRAGQRGSDLERQLSTALEASFPAALREFQTQKKLEAELKNTINTRNAKGHTDLHLIVMHPDELSTLYPHVKISGEERAAYDRKHAVLAALGIQLGAEIDIKDDSQRTVCDIAEKNKDAFPNLYKVIMAGKVVREFDSVHQDKTKRQNISLKALNELCSKFGGAMGTLDQYHEDDVDKTHSNYSSYLASIKNK